MTPGPDILRSPVSPDPRRHRHVRRREYVGLGLSNPAFGDVRAIDRNPPESARAGLAAVIGELEANIAVSRWHRPLRHDVAALTAEPVVCEPRPPILQPKAPAAEPTSLCQNHARRARAWNVHIGRD